MLVRLWRKGNYPALLVGMRIGAAPMENYMAVPQKIKMEQSYEPAILLLSIYSKELKEGPQRNIFIPLFMVALFTITKTWKQSSVHHQTNAQAECSTHAHRHTHTTEYYLALKGKRF